MTEQPIRGVDITDALDHDATIHGPAGQVERLQYLVDHQHYLLKEILNVLTGEQRLAVYEGLFGDNMHYSDKWKAFVP